MAVFFVFEAFLDTVACRVVGSLIKLEVYVSQIKVGGRTSVTCNHITQDLRASDVRQC